MPSPSDPYGDVRRSLRPLPQAPNTSTPRKTNASYHHLRSQTVDNSTYQRHSVLNVEPTYLLHEEGDNLEHQEQIEVRERRESSYNRSHHTRTRSSPHPPALTAAFTAPALLTFH